METRHLFRGRRRDNGEWVYGHCFAMVHFDRRHAHHFIIPLGCDLSIGREIQDIQVEINPATLGQCTSLVAAKSYRGESEQDRLVWEGDIIQWCEWSLDAHPRCCQGTVVWSKLYAGWRIGKLEVPLPGVIAEIIGTVHEEEP